MREKGKLVPELIQFRDYHIAKAYIESPIDFHKDDLDGFEFHLDFQLAFNLEEKMAKSELSIKIKAKPKETTSESNPAEADFCFHYIFRVENLDELTEVENDNSLSVTPALYNALSSMSYSTSRGVLLTQCNGTLFKNFILPVINPNKLLQNQEK